MNMAARIVITTPKSHDERPKLFIIVTDCGAAPGSTDHSLKGCLVTDNECYRTPEPKIPNQKLSNLANDRFQTRAWFQGCKRSMTKSLIQVADKQILFCRVTC